MALTESYGLALKNRRSQHAEGSLMNQHDGSHDAIDLHAGLGNGPTQGGERQGTPATMDPNQQFDRESPMHKDEHTPVMGEKQGPNPKQPGAYSVPEAHASLAGADLSPQAQAFDNEIREHIAGHGNELDYAQLKERGPKTLGERVKMDALKDKYK